MHAQGLAVAWLAVCRRRKGSQRPRGCSPGSSPRNSLIVSEHLRESQRPPGESPAALQVFCVCFVRSGQSARTASGAAQTPTGQRLSEATRGPPQRAGAVQGAGGGSGMDVVAEGAAGGGREEQSTECAVGRRDRSPTSKQKTRGCEKRRV